MSRILHILSQIPSKTGSGIFLDNIITQGRMAGHEQGLVLGLPADYAYLTPETISCFIPVFFETEVLPYKIPGMSDVMPYASTKFSDLGNKDGKAYIDAFEKAIATAIDDFEPDVILSNHLWIVTALAGKLANQMPMAKRPKVYGVSHGTDLRQMNLAPDFKDFVIEHCLKLDGVFCLHQGQLEQIQTLYGIHSDKLHLSGNGYNADIFRRFNREPKGALSLIYAGKLSLSKGVLELIEAVNRLNENRPANPPLIKNTPPPREIRLSLVGKGSGHEEAMILEATAASAYIDYLGFLDQVSLAKRFVESDLFVLPSYYEGLPLVVLEALATGLPVVVTNLPNLKDWLGDEINRSGYISYVELPELEGIDQCKKTAREPFIKALTAALEIQIDKIMNQSYTADFPYEAIEAHSWEAVFKLIAEEIGL